MKEIRGHIESIKSTQKVTNAMYPVSYTHLTLPTTERV